MDLQQVYYVTQIIAVPAVLATLFFVGWQVRQNTNAVKMAAYVASQQKADAFRQMVSSSEELTKIYMYGLQNPSNLDDLQLIRFRLILYNFAKSLEATHVMFIQSKLDLNQWTPNMKLGIRVLGTPGGRAWWDQYKEEFDPGFVFALDEALTEYVSTTSVTGREWADDVGEKIRTAE